jgi:Ser/Thr protein kinase RdoA (MazF antagonist)
MDANLKERIEKLFGLAEISYSEKVDKGFLSENTKLMTSDNKAYFLKKYRFDNEKRIKEIHAAKKYFSDGGVPVIMPVHTRQMQTYFTYNDSYFALFPFVSGLQPERGTLSKAMIVSLGNMLGKIHLLGKESLLEIDDHFTLSNKEEALETARNIEAKLNEIKDKNDFDLLTQEVVTFKKELIEKNDISFEDLNLRSDHLIHGDYLDHNVFFDEHGGVKYVFDFEKTSYEPRTQELFRSATYSFLNTDFDETSIANIRLYIKSYLEVYPIGTEELKNGLLAHFIKSAYGFWVEKEHYLKGNSRVDLFLELNFKRLKFMSERLNDLL